MTILLRLLLLSLACTASNFVDGSGGSNNKKARIVGVMYKPDTPGPPSPAQVVKALLKASIPRVQILGPSADTIAAFKGSGTDLNLSIENSDVLETFSLNESHARRILKDWVVPSLPDVKISSISIGFSVLSYHDELAPHLLPAIKNRWIMSPSQPVFIRHHRKSSAAVNCRVQKVDGAILEGGAGACRCNQGDIPDQSIPFLRLHLVDRERGERPVHKVRGKGGPVRGRPRHQAPVPEHVRNDGRRYDRCTHKGGVQVHVDDGVGSRVSEQQPGQGRDVASHVPQCGRVQRDIFIIDISGNCQVLSVSKEYPCRRYGRDLAGEEILREIKEEEGREVVAISPLGAGESGNRYIPLSLSMATALEAVADHEEKNGSLSGGASV